MSLPGEFICYCGQDFDREVWHCPADAHHWATDDTECRNCHNFELRADGAVAPIERRAS